MAVGLSRRCLLATANWARFSAADTYGNAFSLTKKTLWTGNATTVQGDYQNFGNLYIDVGSHTADAVTDYRRELSISDALGSVSYTANGVSYKREFFSSFPDKVIVVRFTASGSEGQGLLTLTADLNNARTTGTKDVTEKTITFSGKLTTVSYAARLAVLNEGGSVSVVDNKIKVEGANAVTFLLAGITNFDLDSTSFTNGGSPYRSIDENHEGQHIP